MCYVEAQPDQPTNINDFPSPGGLKIPRVRVDVTLLLSKVFEHSNQVHVVMVPLENALDGLVDTDSLLDEAQT